tara:strand:- start:159 stop:320 length:162 start_codon:yes stop_codon:yes gene_type:complete
MKYKIKPLIAQATNVKKPNNVLKNIIKSILNFTPKKMIGGHCRLSLNIYFEKS